MEVSTRLMFLLFFSSVSGLILPLTKPNGDPDMSSIISHVTLMEQRMEQTISSLQSKLQATEIELTTVKANQQRTEDELKVVKVDLITAKTDIAILKHDFQKGSVPTDLTNLTSEVEALKKSHLSPVQQINFTVIDSISSEVKSNMREIQTLNTRQNNTEKNLEATESLVQSLASDVKTVQTHVNTITWDVNGLRQQVSVMKNQIDADQSEQNITKQDLTATTSLVQSTSAEVKSIKSQVNAISGDVHGVITDLEVIKNRTDAEQYEQNSTAQDLTATKALVQSTLVEVKSIKSQVNAISAQNLATMKNRSDVDVAFQVTQNGGNITGVTVLTFDTVDYNIGGGYNNDSGMFTAPVSGTYIFWANVMYRAQKGGVFTIIHKGQHKLARGFYGMEGAHNMGVASTMTVTHMDKGDQVQFTTGYPTDVIWGHYYSSYGGALLHAI